MTRVASDPNYVIAMEARDARACLKQATAAIERAAALAHDEEVRRLTAAALTAADALQLAIGDLRHALAQRAMEAGYTAGR